MNQLIRTLKSDYAKNNLIKVKKFQSKRFDKNKLTFDDEWLIKISFKIINELQSLRDQISYNYKNRHLNIFPIILYEWIPYSFNESYQIFYGTPCGFIQTIIDMYLLYEKKYPYYLLEIYYPINLNINVQIPPEFINDIVLKKIQTSMLSINLLPRTSKSTSPSRC